MDFIYRLMKKFLPGCELPLCALLNLRKAKEIHEDKKRILE